MSSNMELFQLRFPDVAKHETRVAQLRGQAGLPNGDYAFLEHYCDDPDCDCRRVLISVACEQIGLRVLATLNYGWESRAFYASWMNDPSIAHLLTGVNLDPLGPQSEHAPALARLFEWVIQDRTYVERLKRHYGMFKADLRAEGAKRAEDTQGPAPARPRLRIVPRQPRSTQANPRQMAFRFHVALRGIEPPIWRRIEVPATYTFWDLHVAIQDAMGWTDSHLHVFLVNDPETGERERIGIPVDEEFEHELPTVPGWDVPLAGYFVRPGDRAEYEYDFGDNWEHDLVLEEVVPRTRRRKGPACLAGERACPPEDCGGLWGYAELVEAMADPEDERYTEFVEWLGAPFDPAAFAPQQVKFDNPRRRWRYAFGAEP